MPAVLEIGNAIVQEKVVILTVHLTNPAILKAMPVTAIPYLPILIHAVREDGEKNKPVGKTVMNGVIGGQDIVTAIIAGKDATKPAVGTVLDGEHVIEDPKWCVIVPVESEFVKQEEEEKSGEHANNGPPLGLGLNLPLHRDHQSTLLIVLSVVVG